MKNNNIQTGYFARATENGQTGKFTKVHLVAFGKPLCGYRPHETMKFQMNSAGIHLPYVECDKCRDGLRYYFEVDSYENHSTDHYYAKFYETLFGVSLKDVVKDCNRTFATETDARNWGIRCAKLYKKFNTSVGSTIKTDSVTLKKGLAIRKESNKIVDEFCPKMTLERKEQLTFKIAQLVTLHANK